MVTGGSWLRLEERGGGWALAGPGSAGFVLVNEYLGYLGDRNYSPKTVRAYGFDLLAFCRWLGGEDIALAAVTTDVLLRILSACREARVPGRAGGPNVVTLGGRRLDDKARRIPSIAAPCGDVPYLLPAGFRLCSTPPTKHGGWRARPGIVWPSVNKSRTLHLGSVESPGWYQQSPRRVAAGARSRARGDEGAPDLLTVAGFRGYWAPRMRRPWYSVKSS
ncbi:MAG: site-specific integrase [Actinomycetota bacterium]